MHHKRLSQKTLCNVKISGIHPTKIICSRTGAAAHSKAEGEILERKKWPEPTRALGGRGPVCNIKGKEYVDEFLDFRKRTDKQYSCFFFFFFLEISFSFQNHFGFPEKLQRALNAHTRFTQL